MPAAFMERLAEAIHDGWWTAMEQAGWRLGPRSRENRTHPHLLPWSACGPGNNNQDRFEAALVTKYLRDRRRGGPDYEPSDEEVAEQIHEAWVEYMIVEGRASHPHVTHTWDDHDEEGRAEHLAQARHVLRVWEERPWKRTE